MSRADSDSNTIERGRTHDVESVKSDIVGY